MDGVLLLFKIPIEKSHTANAYRRSDEQCVDIHISIHTYPKHFSLFYHLPQLLPDLNNNVIAEEPHGAC